MNKAFIFLATLLMLMHPIEELKLDSILTIGNTPVFDSFGVPICYYIYELSIAVYGISKSRLSKWSLVVLVFCFNTVVRLSHYTVHDNIFSITKDILTFLIIEILLIEVCKIIEENAKKG